MATCSLPASHLMAPCCSGSDVVVVPMHHSARICSHIHTPCNKGRCRDAAYSSECGCTCNTPTCMQHVRTADLASRSQLCYATAPHTITTHHYSITEPPSKPSFHIASPAALPNSPLLWCSHSKACRSSGTAQCLHSPAMPVTALQHVAPATVCAPASTMHNNKSLINSTTCTRPTYMHHRVLQFTTPPR